MRSTKEFTMLTSLYLAQILASTTGQCPKVAQVFKTLTNIHVEDLSKPYLNHYYEVYGTQPDGSNVILYLTQAYSCNYGSRGGGGCMTHYQCSMEVVRVNKKAYVQECEGICAYDNTVIKAGSFQELEEACQSDLYSASKYRIESWTPTRMVRIFDVPATEENSCREL